MTEEELLPFAQKIAAAYCKRYGAWSQLDDATQEACLYLLKKRDLWDAEEWRIKRATFLWLVRWYQTEKKLRRVHRLREVAAPLEVMEAPPVDVVAKLERSELFNEAIKRARFTERERSLALDAVRRTKTREELAAEYRTTKAEIIRLVNLLTVEICKLSDEPTLYDKEFCPLFFEAAWGKPYDKGGKK